MTKKLIRATGFGSEDWHQQMCGSGVWTVRHCDVGAGRRIGAVTAHRANRTIDPTPISRRLILRTVPVPMSITPTGGPLLTFLFQALLWNESGAFGLSSREHGDDVAVLIRRGNEASVV